MVQKVQKNPHMGSISFGIAYVSPYDIEFRKRNIISKASVLSVKRISSPIFE